MEFRKLGKAELRISTIGFGGWAAGGMWWGKIDDRETLAAIQRAFDLGVTLFDTAPIYGNGHSEELLGKALASHRSEIIIVTKFGLDWGDGIAFHARRDASRQRILLEVEDSLRRLGTDYIDIYLQHQPDPDTPVEETMETLVELVEVGKVRYIGVSNFDVPLIEQVMRHAPIVVLQSPYSILQRQIEVEILPFCQRYGLGMLIYGPLHHGLLTGTFNPGQGFDTDDWRRNYNPEFQGERYLRNLRIVEALKTIAAARGVTTAQLAIAWTLMNRTVSCALVGAERPEHIEENIKGAGWCLTDMEMQRIEEIVLWTP